MALPLGADGPPALIHTSGADSSDDQNPRELLLLLLEETVELSSPTVDIMRSNSRDENVTNEERRSRSRVFSRAARVGFVFCTIIDVGRVRRSRALENQALLMGSSEGREPEDDEGRVVTARYPDVKKSE